jgi:hypothetical protein
MFSCPCGAARIGACLLTWCLYMALWSSVFFSESFGGVLAQARAFDVTIGMIAWAVLAGMGFYWLTLGMSAALSHEDEFRLGSFVWSVGVILLVGQRFLAVPAGGKDLYFHIFRMLLAGWLASNAVNIWLQLRSTGRRSERSERLPPAGYLWRRLSVRQTQHAYEEIYEDLQPAPPGGYYHSPPLPAPPHRLVSPVPSIDTAVAVPEIVYVKDGDRFVPVKLGRPTSPSLPTR